MKIEMWPLANVKPYEKNPRKNEGAIDAVAKSIAEFGFRGPIVVDGEDVVIAGHTRLKAAEKLGLAEVPVHIVDVDERTRGELMQLVRRIAYIDA